jgi:hypothetical protein
MGSCKSKVVDVFLVGVDVLPALPAEEIVLARIADKQSSVVCCEKAICLQGGGSEVFARTKAAIMRWDIYGGDTKVYMKDETIKQGAVIAIATKLTSGVYSLSYEDVTDVFEIETDAFSQLRVCVTTRQENVVDGNYSIDLKLHKTDGTRAAGDIELYYQKRQNLQYWLLEKAIGSKDAYRKATQKSVDLTISRLQAFGECTGETPEDVPVDIMLIEGVQSAIISGAARSSKNAGGAGAAIAPADC